VPPDPSELRARLGPFDRDQLLELLVAVAERDPSLARRLTLAAAQADGDLAELRTSVHTAFTAPEHLDYWPTIRHAEAAGEVADLLAELIRDGRADEALPLVTTAIELLLATVGRADDSAGALGDLMRRLLRMHAEACTAADPAVEPLALARWLVEFQLGGQEWFTIDIGEYAQPLGHEGLAAYRVAVARRWTEAPGDFQVRHAREGLARLDRDIPGLIEVIGGELRYAAQFGRLARALADIGERTAAIEWAERGLRAHPEDPPGAGLRDFLVEAYLERGGGSEAVRLRRDGLAAAPTLHSYRALHRAAAHAGIWKSERKRALAVLAKHSPEDHVRALLAEDDVDGAWQAALRLTHLGGGTWDELARRRAASHPADAVAVLRRRIDEVLAATGRDAYRDAIRRLQALREVCAKCGRTAEFTDFVQELADRHRRRPSFLAELTGAGLHT
jgi:hypothetical protein